MNKIRKFRIFLALMCTVVLFLFCAVSCGVPQMDDGKGGGNNEPVREVQEEVGEGQTCGTSSIIILCDLGLTCCPAFPTKKCRDLQGDENNCGSCGVVCTSGYNCLSGHCCPSGQLWCSGACVADNSDSNCGACGNVCVNNHHCAFNGFFDQCMCTGGTTECSGVCKNEQTDSNNCGGCGITCTGGKTCQSGSCTCPAGQTNCSGTCKNEQTDNNNCGGCGIVCSGGKTCQSGSCQCTAGLTDCSGTCVNEQTDVNHCGSCSACPIGGSFCSAGVCEAPCTAVPGAGTRFNMPVGQHGACGNCAGDWHDSGTCFKQGVACTMDSQCSSLGGIESVCDTTAGFCTDDRADTQWCYSFGSYVTCSGATPYCVSGSGCAAND